MSKTATAESSAPVAVEGYYHVGMLPTDKPVKWLVQEKGNTEPTLKEVGSFWQVWQKAPNEVGKELRGVFVAKARQYLGLSVTGCHFPSVNQYVDSTQEGVSRTSFFGGVAWFDEAQLKRVIRSCYDHVIRWTNGFSKIDDPRAQTRLIDLTIGAKPSNMTDQEWSEYKRVREVPQQEKFNPKTDKFVADFVYIRKLDAVLDPQDAEDYAKNPNKFHLGWVGAPSRSFWTDPYKSVSEMYPQARGL